MTAPWTLSITAALAAGVQGGDVLAACRARVADSEPGLHAWAFLAEDAPPAAPGPLGGMPIGVKDVIDTAGLPTESAAAVHRGRRPDADAAAVTLLRRAGATVLGKTATTELATYTPGPTRNPHAPGHTPGGSSSGSAAAVAAGMVPAALGTQTAGSVVRPATFCGVVGYAASVGELPMRGVQALAPSLDTLGILAREVADVALLRAAILGSPEAAGDAPRRLALWRAPGLDPAMRAALDEAAATLADGGAQVEEIDLGDLVESLTEDHITIMAFEAARTLAWEDERRETLGPSLVALIDEGLATSVARVHAARARVEHSAGALRERLAGARALLAAGADGPAPAGLGSTGSPAQSRPWQVLGLPAVSLPAGVCEDGLPLGVQLVGRRFADDDLLGLAAWAEAQLPPAVRPW